MTLNKLFIIHPTSTFKKELQNIIYYIKYKLESPFLADNFYKIVINKISSLKFMPERYMKILNRNRKRNLRRLPINNYVVIYEIDNNTRSSFHFAHLPW
ncbi:MAG: type II toxin-antitoxin system RelE/ParE family toxin [Clostridia bacterium]|nr:type II toxin-antitoxin system RelE/ParE family toxin [Clostridia bacterium]